MPGVSLAAICDKDLATVRGVADKYGVPCVADYRELIGKVDAVTVAVPTEHHCSIACDLLAAGVGVLVEKPISINVEQADEMIAAARRSESVLQVGHLERFNPAVTAAGRIVTRPLFFEAHRLSIFTPRSLDIDVVMDLMIHDIDVVLSMVKSEAVEVRAAGVPVLTPKIDIASARVEFENGCVANFTASRISSERVRKLRFFQPHEYISIDYSAQEAARVRVNHRPGAMPEFENLTLDVEPAEPLRKEIESFLRALEGEPVVTTAAEARKALALGTDITDHIRRHAARAGVPFVG
jgi:predicted dehydrogenase